MYPILFALFIITIYFTCLIIACELIRPKLWVRYKKKLRLATVARFIAYIFFVIIDTCPDAHYHYSASEKSLYKLPWEAEVSRFVAQGNRSFVSHRGLHNYAWDFVMKNGTEVLTSREGLVVEVVDSFKWVSIKPNYILIEHEDRNISGYAHIRFSTSVVKV